MPGAPITSFLAEFLAFLRARKRYWLVPLAAILILMALLVFLTQGTALAPLIYGIF